MKRSTVREFTFGFASVEGAGATAFRVGRPCSMFPQRRTAAPLPPTVQRWAGGDAAGDFLLLSPLVIGTEQEDVQAERNQREHLLAPLLHDLRLFLERPVDFAVHPPTGKR